MLKSARRQDRARILANANSWIRDTTLGLISDTAVFCHKTDPVDTWLNESIEILSCVYTVPPYSHSKHLAISRTASDLRRVMKSPTTKFSGPPPSAAAAHADAVAHRLVEEERLARSSVAQAAYHKSITKQRAEHLQQAKTATSDAYRSHVKSRLKQLGASGEAVHELSISELQYMLSVVAFACCPITKVFFRDPVILADGHSYEKEAAMHWLKMKTCSYVTGQPLPHQRFHHNYSATQVVDAAKGYLRTVSCL